MEAKTIIKLDRFIPRDYQLPIMDAIINKQYKRVLVIMGRRAGKDVCAFNIVIRMALKRVGVYFYLFPTYSQGRKILFDSITIDGQRFLDYIPKELVLKINIQEMKITLINQSIIQVCGTDNIDNLVGTNPVGCVFSEYALQDRRAYEFLRPALLVNDGWALFVSTPRGKNHLWDLYNIANNNKDWFVYKRSVLETKHVSLEEIAQEEAEGLMSHDLIQQEYFCNFEQGQIGTYYNKYIDRLKLNNQITNVPWDPSRPVYSSWDIGVRDSTSIILFQTTAGFVNIIDCYENSKEGLEHYISVLKSKPYQYGAHIGPHDLRQREFTSGLSRIEKASQLGIDFTIADNISIMDGIEAVRTTLPKCYIDQVRCAKLIRALENYRQEWDERREVYKPVPVHDQYSHFCFTSDTLLLTRSGMRAIINIEDQEEVLTLNGWKRCTKSWIAKSQAKLVKVIFQDGTIVKCTPEHLFLTDSGWRSAKSLKKDTLILSSLTSLHKSFVEKHTVYGQEKNIWLKHLADNFTKMSGFMPLEKFLMVAISIIEIIILEIIDWRILNACQQVNIWDFQKGLAPLSHSNAVMQLINGMHRKKESYGIKSTLEKLVLETPLEERKDFVYSVIKNLMLLLENFHKNSVMLTVKPLLVDAVEKLNYLEDVYDISVPDIQHFSLSNGAIVHNSDSMRYLSISLNKLSNSGDAARLNQRFARATGQYDNTLPRFFQ